MKCPGTTYVVVGSGSIGRRHMTNLRTLFPEAIVGCVSASGRPLSADECGAHRVIPDIESAVTARPRFAVIASPAPFHLKQALPFLKAGIPTLIEKPLCSSLTELKEYSALLVQYQHLIEIGYNLRYLPCAVQFKSLLDQQHIGPLHHVRIEVGQYLPDWRPGIDYRAQVSAQRHLGGGALLELSHELDYLLWIFGSFTEVSAISQNSGTLGINVEDSVDAMLYRADGPVVSLHLDLLQRTPTRYCTVTGEKGKLHCEFLANRLIFTDASGKSHDVHVHDDYQPNSMYLDEIKRFDKRASSQLPPKVSLEQAINIMMLIEAIRLSSEQKRVIRVEDCRC
ncbi:Gfo/Idh/MocA family protein [Lacimicrobium alkaliphilum]|uniref:Oxidoreductase n=1 Tax=Lacimicrobium alkaliphilum TaxID=1526571 RepID=A0ABQ1RK31_9ALTE|nr:Gfo/Idh/MocA family oxidoreductase [Lacimicrobium alkaliphilum]GGD72535.1 oxidoreductase [Lacimicrobium alkaliphilum]